MMNATLNKILDIVEATTIHFDIGSTKENNYVVTVNSYNDFETITDKIFDLMKKAIPKKNDFSICFFNGFGSKDMIITTFDTKEECIMQYKMCEDELFL